MSNYYQEATLEDLYEAIKVLDIGIKRLEQNKKIIEHSIKERKECINS